MPAVMAFAHGVRVVEMQRGDTRGKLCRAYCVALTGMVAVARVLPSGALGECDVRAVVVVLGELGLVGVLREGP